MIASWSYVSTTIGDAPGIAQVAILAPFRAAQRPPLLDKAARSAVRGASFAVIEGELRPR
jgi:hypothetical protein